MYKPELINAGPLHFGEPRHPVDVVDHHYALTLGRLGVMDRERGDSTTVSVERQHRVERLIDNDISIQHDKRPGLEVGEGIADPAGSAQERVFDDDDDVERAAVMFGEADDLLGAMMRVDGDA